ncbi:MAG: hypothetical protein Q9220_000503 [cf. Caloplaca sp. 1 TL-2023]
MCAGSDRKAYSEHNSDNADQVHIASGFETKMRDEQKDWQRIKRTGLQRIRFQSAAAATAVLRVVESPLELPTQPAHEDRSANNICLASHEAKRMPPMMKTMDGRRLQDVAMPAAIVDRAIAIRNCSQMLGACEALGIAFRPHIKTHKTIEVTRLQLGDKTHNAHLVVSTLAEADFLLDFLLGCQDQGRNINVLYGIPLPPSSIQRLAAFGKKLRPGSVSVLIDHHDQLQHLELFKGITGYPLILYIKIDTGYHRAGVTLESPEFSRLISEILGDGELKACTELGGLYSHSGHSYGGNSAVQAMALLIEETQQLQEASVLVKELSPNTAPRKLVLSIGATPSATAIKNLFQDPRHASTQTLEADQIETFNKCRESIKANQDILEIHAGVYPFLDMQQLATQASPSPLEQTSSSALSTLDVALTILAEVSSVYNTRDTPEALVAAGSMALGREPCKSYPGWGIVSDWGFKTSSPDGHSGWQVGRISQEHGILNRASPNGEPRDLSVGQKLRIYPNHACIAGAAFGWYLVVDSDGPEDQRDVIVDVWIRCRGW